MPSRQGFESLPPGSEGSRSRESPAAQRGLLAPRALARPLSYATQALLMPVGDRMRTAAPLLHRSSASAEEGPPTPQSSAPQFGKFSNTLRPLDRSSQTERIPNASRAGTRRHEAHPQTTGFNNKFSKDSAIAPTGVALNPRGLYAEQHPALPRPPNFNRPPPQDSLPPLSSQARTPPRIREGRGAGQTPPTLQLRQAYQPLKDADSRIKRDPCKDMLIQQISAVTERVRVWEKILLVRGDGELSIDSESDYLKRIQHDLKDGQAKLQVLNREWESKYGSQRDWGQSSSDAGGQAASPLSSRTASKGSGAAGRTPAGTSAAALQIVVSASSRAQDPVRAVADDFYRTRSARDSGARSDAAHPYRKTARGNGAGGVAADSSPKRRIRE
jgi:hypothetical protein